MKNRYPVRLECRCRHPDHSIQVTLDEDGEVVVSTLLAHPRPLLRRVWNVFLYLLKREQGYGHFATTIVDDASLTRLEKIILKRKIRKKLDQGDDNAE